MNTDAAVMKRPAMPVAYMIGLKAEPGCRQPSASTSNRGWKRLVALAAFASAEPT